MIEVEKKVTNYNATYYVIKGTLIYHREDGPAIEWSSGRKEWYKHGELHREDGPAVILSRGSLYWYKHGMIHRVDGPAIIGRYGAISWYLEDQFFRTKEDWFEALNEEEKSKAIYSKHFIGS